MTKYYLHGGYATVPSDENRKFYAEVLSSIGKDDINILIIPFARDASVWDKKANEIKCRFDEVCGLKNIKFHIATNTVVILKYEILNSDIVFIWGGDTGTLQKALEQVPSIGEAFQEKVVAGSSAGALVLSEYYYENDTDSYRRGLGIIAGGMICHWKNQDIQKGNIEKIVGIGRILCIPEGQYIVKEV